MTGWTPINFYTATGVYDLQPCHAGQGSIIGDDGKRYAVIQITPGSGHEHYPVLYCYDTGTTLLYGASETYAAGVTKMQADLTALALSGAPSSSNFGDINETFAVANSRYFVVMGFYGRSGGAQLAFVRYKINASGNIELVDGCILRCSSADAGLLHVINRFGLLNQSTVVDCRIIGSTLYIAGSGQTATGQDTILISIPLALFGTCDNTVGSYENVVSVLAHGNLFLWPFFPSYINCQRGVIVSVSGNVGLLAYAGVGSIANSTAGNPFFSGGVEYNGSPRLIFAYNNLGFTDYGSAYGIPFSDTSYNYAGTLGSNANDDYCGPSLMTFSGKDYIVFTRIYSDQGRTMRFKVFRWGDAVNLVQDWTGTFFENAIFPHPPTASVAVNIFMSPTGNGHLILQSDDLSDGINPGYRLYTDFGPLPAPSTARTRIWGNIAPRPAA